MDEDLNDAPSPSTVADGVASNGTIDDSGATGTPPTGTTSGTITVETTSAISAISTNGGPAATRDVVGNNAPTAASSLATPYIATGSSSTASSNVATISATTSSVPSPALPFAQAPPSLPFQRTTDSSPAATAAAPTPQHQRRPNFDAILRMTREATISAAPSRGSSCGATDGVARDQRPVSATTAAVGATRSQTADSDSFKSSITQGINGHWLLFFGLTTAIVGVLVTLLGFTLLSYSEVTFGLLLLLVACVMMTVGIVRLNRRPRSSRRTTASGETTTSTNILNAVRGAQFTTVPGLTPPTMPTDYGGGRFGRQPPWAWSVTGDVEGGIPAEGEAPPAYQPTVILLQPPSYEEATSTTTEAAITTNGAWKDPDTTVDGQAQRHQQLVSQQPPPSPREQPPP